MDFLQRLFLNPELLGWTGLVSVPIIIYLINRHRYRRRRWAAMEFILKALKKAQRRIQIQNLLLLLIRVAVVLLLVLAAARPVLRHGPLGLNPDGPQNWIFLLDTSYSMGYRDGPTSLFDRARESIAQAVDDLLEPGDKLALATLGYEPRILVGASPKTGDTVERVRTELEDVKLSNQGLRLMPSLALVEEIARDLAGETGAPVPFRVIFFSDLQRKDWIAGGEARSPEARDILRELQDRGGGIFVANLALEREKLNVGITELSVRPELVARSVPLDIQVTVRNWSDVDAEGLDLSVQVDPPDEGAGEAQLGEVIRVPAGSSLSRRVPFRFDTAGHHTVVAELRSDGLVVDNRRYLVVPVREEVRILLVDGDPAAEALDRETFYLSVALQPGDDSLGGIETRFTPFLPETVLADEFAELGPRELKRYALVVLANVADLGRPEEVEELERYVASGRALMVFVGDNVRPDLYNAAFHRSGRGLLPLPLGGKTGDARVAVHLELTEESHPLVAYFLEHRQRTDLLSGIIPFHHYFQVGDPEGAPSSLRIFARFGDLASTPAAFDHAFGRGRVLWFNSTADQEWNEFPAWQDFVVFVHEAVSYLLGFTARANNLQVGTPIHQYYESDQFAPAVQLRVPSAPESELGGTRTVRLTMREVVGEDRYQVAFDGARTPGIYRLDLHRPHGKEGVEYFAVNVDTEESDLRGMTAEDFEAAYAVKPVLFDVTQRSRVLATQRDLLRGTEYWSWLLAAVLALMLVETALAQIFGRRAR